MCNFPNPFLCFYFYFYIYIFLELVENIPNPSTFIRDVNVLIFLDFSFRYDSVHQKYKRLKRYVAHYEIFWHIVTLRNEFSALEYLIQR